jgi:hypothetical protein
MSISSFTEMLASLLPGLRDLRTPLTVGYLWLICGWLWFHRVLPRRDTARGAMEDLYHLYGILPPAAGLAALSFIAYFLGSILELDPLTLQWFDMLRLNRTAWGAVADRIRIRLDAKDLTQERYSAAEEAWFRIAPARTTRDRPNWRIILLHDLPWQQVRRDWASEKKILRKRRILPETPGLGSASFVSTSLSPPGGYVWRRNPWSETSDIGTTLAWRGPGLPVTHGALASMPILGVAVLLALRDEVPDLATELLIQRPEVFDRYDRLLAEASIRINMFPPAAALIATLALRAHGLWWLGMGVCAALFYRGVVLRSRAIAVVLNSVSTRLIKSPTMEAVSNAQRGETENANEPTTEP